MTTYKVRWEIDIDADNVIEAAEKALAIQRDPNSTATVFEVTCPLLVDFCAPDNRPFKRRPRAKR